MPSYHHKLIERCSKCLKASCWHGEYMCDDAKGAGTVLKSVGELRRLDLEHPSNYSAAKLKEIYGETAPHGYGNVEGK